MSKDIDKSSFLFAANSGFVEDLYLKYIENPESLDQDWRNFFEKLGDNELAALKATVGASWLPRKNKVILPPEISKTPAKTERSEKSSATNIDLLISDYRAFGHFLTNLDPLGLEKKKDYIKLDLARFGLNEADLSKEVNVGAKTLGFEKATIAQVIDKLKSVYCSTVGYEIAHLNCEEEKQWFYEHVEQSSTHHAIPNESKISALKDLIDLESFEQFIHTRFPGTKRFSAEGGESSILAISEVIKTATNKNNVREVIIGMAHRGRLNVLTKIMGKDYASMLSEFQGNLAHVESLNISGDVKYHLGKSSKYFTKDGREVHLSLTANPSHLEAVNPVVSGKVRAKQDGMNDKDRSKVLGIVLHGDAAFMGQGVVIETMVMSNLEGYTTGGIMHIVVNNQVGFTTLPKDGRVSRYPTEFAKAIQAPIIHVNGDDVENVILACEIAESYRHKFKKDVVIDVVCYRKYGHNEGDEPMFTQPIMYERIKQKESVVEVYAKELERLGVFSVAQAKAYQEDRFKFLDKKLEEAKTYKPVEEDWLQGKWKGLDKSDRVKTVAESTGVALTTLKNIGKALVSYPEGFNVNSKILRLFEQKKKMFETGKDIDWATAEALAYGSLLLEGSHIRMSGQDCKRGTFSHRHAVLFDQKTENEYTSLNHISDTQGMLEVYNSNLSEYAVLGFEYGYSTVDPKNLTIWEAQFGDFSNGAQIMIDQFIASAEVKWLRMSGLVMLLPHGYEGQGPEHSSARLERYLQLCAEDNMQVVNCTSPANFFHVLRRQLHRAYRKPLIVMSPKSLLRHKMVVSNLSDMAENTSFKPVIGEVDNINGNLKKIVICSGKVYFDLYEQREKLGIKDIALIRIEQYYPFADEALAAEIKKYNKDAKIVWCQEEPENMGAWRYIEHRIKNCVSKIGYDANIEYIGRPEAASPSAGYYKMHNIEQEKIINQVMTGV